MTRKAQTESELAFFERFRAITGLLAGLPVTPQRPPEPDLVVQTATGAVGLELTELVTGPVQRSVESAQGKTLERAEAVFAAEMGHPLFVRLYWRHLAGPRRPDPQLATWIAATIRANPPPHSGTVILDSTEPGGPLSANMSETPSILEFSVGG